MGAVTVEWFDKVAKEKEKIFCEAASLAKQWVRSIASKPFHLFEEIRKRGKLLIEQMQLLITNDPSKLINVRKTFELLSEFL